MPCRHRSTRGRAPNRPPPGTGRTFGAPRRADCPALAYRRSKASTRKERTRTRVRTIEPTAELPFRDHERIRFTQDRSPNRPREESDPDLRDIHTAEVPIAARWPSRSHPLDMHGDAGCGLRGLSTGWMLLTRSVSRRFYLRAETRGRGRCDFRTRFFSSENSSEGLDYSPQIFCRERVRFTRRTSDTNRSRGQTASRTCRSPIAPSAHLRTFRHLSFDRRVGRALSTLDAHSPEPGKETSEGGMALP